MIDHRIALVPAQAVQQTGKTVSNIINRHMQGKQNQISNEHRNKLLDFSMERHSDNVNHKNRLFEQTQSLQNDQNSRAQESHEYEMDMKTGNQMHRSFGVLKGLPPESRKDQIELMKDKLTKHGFDDDDWPLLETDEGLDQAINYFSQYAPKGKAALHKLGHGDKLVTSAGETIAENAKPQDNSKGFDQEGKLRGEFTKFAKDFQTQNASFGRLQASANNPTAAGDLALIFNFMKLLDPGSTVREGEFSTAQGAFGALNKAEDEGSYVPNFIKRGVQQLVDGTRLLPAQREDFYGRARALFEDAQEQHGKLSQRYTNLAGAYDLDPSRVVIDLQTADPGKVVNLGSSEPNPLKAFPEGSKANSDGSIILPDGRVVRPKQ